MEFYFHIASGGKKNQFSVALSLKYKHSERQSLFRATAAVAAECLNFLKLLIEK